MKQLVQQSLRIGQEVRVMDRGKWQKTTIRAIDYMDTNNQYPYRFHLANGQIVYNETKEMDWQGKPKPTPKTYTPRQWHKNQKVKFKPYSSLRLKPEYGTVIESAEDETVTILTPSGVIICIPEVNILTSV